MLANLIVLCMVKFGEFLGKLVYGGKGLRAREILGKKTETIGRLGVFLFLSWIMLLASAMQDHLWGIIGAVGIPMIYVVWFVIARINNAKVIREACGKIGIAPEDFKATTPSNPMPEEPVMEADTRNAGQWKCSCGRMNAMYVSTCVCGCDKRNAQNANKGT